MYTTLTPRLVVADVDAAIAFYAAVLGARAGLRLTDADGRVLHAEIDVAGLRMSLTQSGPDPDPDTLGGSPVFLTLLCDPDDVQARGLAHGATMIHPVADRYYGMRDGRMRDPFGHLWLITKVLDHIEADELQRRSEATSPGS